MNKTKKWWKNKPLDKKDQSRIVFFLFLPKKKNLTLKKIVKKLFKLFISVFNY